MLPLALAVASFASDPSGIGETIDLARIDPSIATSLRGRLVKSNFEITCPPDQHGGITVIGTGVDAVERGAHVPKDLLLDKGDTVVVWGVLDVIHHKAAVVNGQFVPPSTELRIVGYVRSAKR